VAIGSLALALTSACGSSDSSGGGSDKGDDQFSVGIVRFAPSEVTTEAVIKDYTKLAEAAGWKVSTANPDAAVDKAIGAMQDFVQKKVDLIIVGAFASKSLTSGLRAAQEAGIPVATIAGGPADGVNFNFAIADGVEIPEQMVKDMGGKGKALALTYSPGDVCQIRGKAFKKTLAGTDITVDEQEVTVPGQLESGQKLTNAWLSKNLASDEPLAIWACWDDPALGAIVAVQQAKRSDVKIYGYNGTPPALKALSDGQMRATAAPDIEASAKAIFDETPGIIKAGAKSKPKDYEGPYTLITTDTIADYLAAHPAADAS
jgi:ABC-type sugar transport system substrate-binding protein